MFGRTGTIRLEAPQMSDRSFSSRPSARKAKTMEEIQSKNLMANKLFAGMFKTVNKKKVRLAFQDQFKKTLTSKLVQNTPNKDKIFSDGTNKSGENTVQF